MSRRPRSTGRDFLNNTTNQGAQLPRSISSSPALAPTRRKRIGTLYDAVAGRLTQHGFVDQPSALIPSYYRDVPASEHKVLRPDEALLRSERAPDRYQEDDYYAQHRHLVASEEEVETQRAFIDYVNEQDVGTRGFDGKAYDKLQVKKLQRQGMRWSDEEVEALKGRIKVGQVPDVELCAAVHEFTSLFYEVHGGRSDWQSLDETALLAMGVLLEETVRKAMGETGWMAFVEGEVLEDERPARKAAARDRSRKRTERAKVSDSETEASGGFLRGEEDSQGESVPEPKPKRRKISAEEAGLGDDW